MTKHKLNVPECKMTESDKMFNIIRILHKMGYSADDAKSAIHVIEKRDLDKSQFDFPYGSFEETKSHVLDDEFAFSGKSFLAGEDECKTLYNDVKENKLWARF